MKVISECGRSRSAVVVAAHKMYEQLEDCLSGLLRIVSEKQDLIFVDNGSGGSLSEWVEDRFEGVSIIRKAENTFFCGGYNAGLQHAMQKGYEFALIVNADAEIVDGSFLRNLETELDKFPRTAFAGPLVYSDAEETVQNTCLRFPRFWEALVTWVPYRILPRSSFQQATKPTKVEVLNGVCVLCRLSALEEIGLMEESFGGYIEDSEWAWRAEQLGWDRRFVAQPSIIHRIEEFGYEHYSFKTFLLKRNTSYFYLKTGQFSSAFGYSAVSIWLAALRLVGNIFNSTARKRSAIFFQILFGEYVRLFSAFFENKKQMPVLGIPKSVSQLSDTPVQNSCKISEK